MKQLPRISALAAMVLVLGCYHQTTTQAPEAPAPTPTPIPAPTPPAPEPAPEPKTQDGPAVYINTDFGFRMTFPSRWKGYKVFREDQGNSAVATYGVYLPFKDPNYESGEHPGYVRPMSIHIFSRAEWDATDDHPMMILLGKNADYAFAYIHWADAPSGSSWISEAFDQVAASFTPLK